MSAYLPTKALLLAVQTDPTPAISILQRLHPEMVCFFLQESCKHVVESDVHPALSQMPQRWDWILTPDTESFPACHKALAQGLGPLLTTWNVTPGDLAIDLTSASPAMASAMTLVGFPFSTQVWLIPANSSQEEISGSSTQPETSENPWDEEAPRLRQEACDLFNNGWHEAAARAFHTLEHRISGGLKPFYRALADIAQGFGLWEQLLYRLAWEKIKSGIKALELASVWGGPPGMERVITTLKGNARFLESIVLDAKEIKPSLAHDLMAWAKRRGDRGRDLEMATRVLLRGLEAAAQVQLSDRFTLKSWDITVEQLPKDLQDTCRTRYLNEIDGKYRLPLQAQFQALAGLGDPMGQRFATEWPKMKSLFDAADHAVLGYGFEPLKAERFHQLYELTMKLTGTAASDLPVFPSLKF
ncbi:MAG: TIGR02710 family CRISPR-associated CARF protein [Nitrospirales bacterium]